MIGKRGIVGKRPAVLCAAAFVAGIVLAGVSGRSGGDTSGWLMIGIAVGLLGGYVLLLRHLQRGRRRVSAADKLLVFVPVFLLLGGFVMNRETRKYERHVATFTGCMETGGEVLAEGTVSHIRWTESGVRLELRDARVMPYAGEETNYRPVGKLLVYVDDIVAENGEIKHGQEVFVYGKGSQFEEASNPGGFDAKAYYFSLGITGAIHGKTVRITSFSYHRLNQALFQVKNKLLKSYVTYLGEDGAGVISSMLLGERVLLSDETQELYRHGGISHILAISGLHVSVIGMALYEFLRKTFLGQNGAIPVACAGVILYGTFVEAGTSTKRAVIMFLLLLLATALGRTYDTLSAMSVSAVVILCGSPGALYTASFQLSFAAAYGASVLAVVLKERREAEERQEFVGKPKSLGLIGTAKQPKWQEEGKQPKWLEEAKQLKRLEEGNQLKRLEEGKQPEWLEEGNQPEWLEEANRVAKRENRRWFRLWEYCRERGKDMFRFGLAVQAVTFPFTVYHFFEYPTYGFLLNPIVVPLMTLLLLCGLLSGVCGLFCPWLGYFFAGGTGGILWIYDMLCHVAEKLPGSLLLIGRPTVGQIGVYFGGLVLVLVGWQERGRKRARHAKTPEHDAVVWLRHFVRKGFERVVLAMENQTVVFVLLLILPLCLLPLPGAMFEVAFLDVGQGDGIVMRERSGATLLVDGGSTSVQKVGEKRIIPYLKSQGIRVIDCAFVSHTDSDHMNGLKEILEAMPVYSEYRESTFGYTGTPVIKCIVLPELYGEKVRTKVQKEAFGGTEPDQKEILSVELTENVEPDQAYLALVELAKEKKVAVSYLAAGDRMKVGEKLVFSCLAPEAGIVYADKNAASMVLLTTYGEFDLLLTGDMNREGELRVLKSGVLGDKRGNADVERAGGGGVAAEQYEPISIEVLKVAHHGSYTASSEEFMMALQPLISVISCGKNNRYGHPHKETLDTLYGVNSRVYRTDESGCVTVKVGKKGRFGVDD